MEVSKIAREGRFDYFLVEPLPVATPRLGRRTVLTLPLLPPPQKNRSPPSDSSPETLTPGGMSSVSRTSPVRGSTHRKSLWSPSQASIQVTPVTKRFGLDRAVPILPHPERLFGPREPRVTAAAGRRVSGEHSAGLRVDLLDATRGEPEQVLAVEGCSRIGGDIDRAQRFPLAGSKAFSLSPAANQTC